MRLLLSTVCLIWGVLVAEPAAAATPEAGMLLIARDGLPDIRFHETVVLLVQSNAQGTAGLILNRPSRLTLTEGVPDLPALATRQGTLAYGGPLAPRALMALVKTVEPPPDPSQKVFATVYLTGAEQLSDWLGGERPGMLYRVFAGYAGWAPGQLDREMERGDWQVLPADEALVFAGDITGVWQKLVRRDEPAPPR